MQQHIVSAIGLGLVCLGFLKHIEQYFCSDASVMPKGGTWGAGGHFFNMVMWHIKMMGIMSRTECKYNASTI